MGIGLRAFIGDALHNERSRWYFTVNNTLAAFIAGSVALLILETVPSIHGAHPRFFDYAEAIIFSLFCAEYLLRLWTANRPWNYLTSFFGIVDLIAILPGIVSLILPIMSLQAMAILRVLRILRILRTIRLVRFVIPTRHRVRMARALARGVDWFNIELFLFAFMSFIVIAATLLYVVEGNLPDSPFATIPHGMWWAIVTMTTVGYGDVVPMTVVGKLIASVTMFSGLVFLALMVTVLGGTSQKILFGSKVE